MDAPDDGSQYGRTNGEWTEIVHTPEYTDADVDTHLNVSTANAGQILAGMVLTTLVVDQAGGGGLEVALSLLAIHILVVKKERYKTVVKTL